MPYINLLIKPASSLCNMRCRYCFYADEAANREPPRGCGRSPKRKKSDAEIIENDRRRGGVDRF